MEPGRVQEGHGVGLRTDISEDFSLPVSRANPRGRLLHSHVQWVHGDL